MNILFELDGNSVFEGLCSQGNAKIVNKNVPPVLTKILSTKNSSAELSTAKILLTINDAERLDIADELSRYLLPTPTLHFLASCSLNNTDIKSPILSSAIAKLIRTKGSAAQLNNLCQLLKFRPSLLNLTVKDCNEAIFTCLKRSPADAMDWYLLMVEVLDIQPDVWTYESFLVHLAKSPSWDQFFFVYNDMQSHGLSPSKKTMEDILSVAASNAAVHWHQIRRLIIDLDRFSNKWFTGMLSTNQNLDIINPNLLFKIFLALIQVDQASEARKLFLTLVDLQKKRDDSSGGFTFPIHHNLVTESAGLAAVILQDQSLLASILECSNIGCNLPLLEIAPEKDLSSILDYSSNMYSPEMQEAALTEGQISTILSQHCVLLTWALSQVYF